MVIFYLLYKQLVDVCSDFEFSYKTIFDYVKTRRVIIDPNTAFKAQMKEFEQKVRSGEMKQMVLNFRNQTKLSEVEESKGFKIEKKLISNINQIDSRVHREE